MRTLDKTPRRIWYFLLCYLSYSAYTFYFMSLETIRPQLMILYKLSSQDIAPYYDVFYWGLLLGIMLFGILVNLINYRTCFVALSVMQVMGVIKLLSLSPIIVSTTGIHQLIFGMLLIGTSCGGIFAVIHPLVACIFEDPKHSKTKIMNYLHTNWPLLIILTTLFKTILSWYHLDWFWMIYAGLFLSLSYFVVAMFLPLPVQTQIHRIPVFARLKSTLRPGYFLLLFCMIGSCLLEFSPTSWIKDWVAMDFKIAPLSLLVFTSMLQLVARLMAGFIVKKISPPGLLTLATILSVLSLYLLSLFNNIGLILMSVAMLSIGTAFYWPTYIAIVADRYPLSGGVGMAVMNLIGYYSLFHVVPEMSQFIQVENTRHAFADLAHFGVISFILLIGVLLSYRAQGGYKVLSMYDRSL